MTADAGPTARALLALAAIQEQPGVNATRLAARLGVSERAARRYVSILREAGIPVESERGPYGGYRIGRSLKMAPMVFTAEEAIGLVMAVLDGHHDTSDPDDPAGTALAKLLGSLPTAIAAQADVVRRTAAAAPDRGAARPLPGVTTRLVEACAQHRRVRVEYRSEAGREWSADVDPWSVVVRHGRWYLVCWSHRADAVRTYRVDRIRDVAVLTPTFTPPDELDAVTLLETHLAAGWEYEAVVTIDAPLDAVAPCLPRSLGRLEAIDASTCRLVGSTSNPTWYAEQLAAVAAPFRVDESPEIRAAVAAIGDRFRAASS